MKLLEKCTLNELKELLGESVSYDKIELVYDYLHRNKVYTVHSFANSKNVSIATLYRHINNIKRLYERYS